MTYSYYLYSIIVRQHLKSVFTCQGASFSIVFWRWPVAIATKMPIQITIFEILKSPKMKIFDRDLAEKRTFLERKNPNLELVTEQKEYGIRWVGEKQKR